MRTLSCTLSCLVLASFSAVHALDIATAAGTSVLRVCTSTACRKAGSRDTYTMLTKLAGTCAPGRPSMNAAALQVRVGVRVRVAGHLHHAHQARRHLCSCLRVWETGGECCSAAGLMSAMNTRQIAIISHQIVVGSHSNRIQSSDRARARSHPPIDTPSHARHVLVTCLLVTRSSRARHALVT